MRRLIILASLILSTFAIPVLADPPGRVGRISAMSGTVSYFGEQDEGWKPALLNYPLTSENSIWTEANSQAEIRIAANAFRIGSDTVLDFPRLDDDKTIAFLQRGSISIRIRDLENLTTFRIDTELGQATLEAPGRYRFQCNIDECQVSIFSGRARWQGRSNSLTHTLEAGRTVVMRDNTPITTLNRTTETDIDLWANTRDADWDRAHNRYSSETIISSQMTGYEVLDEYGAWLDEPEYGRVWIPRTASSNWIPYRDGRWAWVSPWGWTWIDNAPWGFAPFHYGRWVQLRDRWAWWPGNSRYRPIYAPALVAWGGDYSSRSGVSLGLTVSWFPLAPYEPFLPSYTSNVDYIRRINWIYRDRPLVLGSPSQYRYYRHGQTAVNQQIFIQSRHIDDRVIVRGSDSATGRGTNYLPRPHPSNAGRIDVPRYRDNRTNDDIRPRIDRDDQRNAIPRNPPMEMPSRRYDAPAMPRYERPRDRGNDGPGNTTSQTPAPIIQPTIPFPMPRHQEYAPEKRSPSKPAQEGISVIPVPPSRFNNDAPWTPPIQMPSRARDEPRTVQPPVMKESTPLPNRTQPGFLGAQPMPLPKRDESIRNSAEPRLSFPDAPAPSAPSAPSAKPRVENRMY